MKLINRIALCAVAATFILGSIPSQTLARGGGGHGGMGGGGGGGRGWGGGGRGWGGYGGMGWGGYGGWGMGGWGYGLGGGFGDYYSEGPTPAYNAENAQMSNPDRPSAFSRGYGGSGTLSTAVDQTWNGGGNQSIAMDGAFGRAASSTSMSQQGHYTTANSQQILMSMGSSVRMNFAQKDIFTKPWFASHKGGWSYPAWSDFGGWENTNWPAIASFWNMPVVNAPTDYDYGVNILYMNGQIYYGSQPIGTAAQYYQQAQILAASQPAATISQPWKSLGVFALVGPNSSNPTAEFQLSVNQNGAIRGSYYEPLSNQVKPVYGAVDRKSWRASWTVGADKNVVYDTGFSNLLQAQGGMLLHYSKDHTQQMALVRLQR